MSADGNIQRHLTIPDPVTDNHAMSSSLLEQTNILASARAVPHRVLIVDNEQSMLADISTALASPDLDVMCVGSGEEALTLMARQWIPVLVTDDEMPDMNGIALVHRVRALEAKPTYVIMLSSTSDNRELERGYCAGVDQHVARRNWPATLPMKVADGLKSLRLRRIGRPKLAHESIVTIDLQSDAHTARHLVGRLCAEITLARRQQSTVTVVVLGLHHTASGGGREVHMDAQLTATLAAFKGALRPQLGWVAWLHASGNDQRFAVVLPSAATEAAAFIASVRNAFATTTAPFTTLTFGTASFDAKNEAVVPTALELLAKAEGARRSAAASAGAFSTLQRD
jgi:CheY-like chemotaxis protein